MNQIDIFLRLMLWLHIVGGTSALLSGLVAMLSIKGGRRHRAFGKVYFWSMTAVFIGALALAIGHRKDFLLMVAFFSYYMTVRGYRILYLKNLVAKQRPALVDYSITVISAAFILFLIMWGTYALVHRIGMGAVGLVFGGIGLSLLSQDIRSFFSPPVEKMHWWYTHIASMGGSYIAATTAFLVVNIQIQNFNWILWILPAMIGTILIRNTIRRYKIKFAR